MENTETIKSTEIQNLEKNSDIVIESNITEMKQGSTEEDSTSSSKEYSSTRNSKINENEINIVTFLFLISFFLFHTWLLIYMIIYFNNV